MGTYAEIPPFSTIIDIGNYFKDAASVKYGEPPYGHAELSSLSSFAKKTEIDLVSGMKLLKDAGYNIADESDTLQEIAANNGVSPQQIYLAMIPKTSEKRAKLPQNPPAGTGTLTLAEFCTKYDLDIKAVMRVLIESGMTVKEEMTIKSIGEANKLPAMEIYEKIKSTSNAD